MHVSTVTPLMHDDALSCIIQCHGHCTSVPLVINFLLLSSSEMGRHAKYLTLQDAAKATKNRRAEYSQSARLVVSIFVLQDSF